MITRFVAAAAVSLFCSATMAAEISIGFLSLDNDPRHDAALAYANVELRPAGNSEVGARLGLIDSAMLAEATGNTLKFDPQSAPDGPGLVARAKAMSDAGIGFIILDVPGDMVQLVAEQSAGLPVTFVNATAPDNFLRSLCLPNLLHTAASDRMEADAMVQFLRNHNWPRILLLVGQEPRDRVIADAFIAAAQRYRLTIVEERPFTLAADPENREANNVLLLTGQADYDVIYVADSIGEFSRYLPYATQLPRPVLGSTGLVASAWSYTLERYGAPQVSSRFEDLADGRHMAGPDWSAWMAAKAIAMAYAKSRSTDPVEVGQFLRGPKLKLDGSKGVAMNFRDWDGQLRMPLVLATTNAVIAIPPLAGFQHQTNDLDTLGTDRPEQVCQ